MFPTLGLPVGGANVILFISSGRDNWFQFKNPRKGSSMVSFARGWNHLPVLPGSKKALEIPFFETSIVDFPTAFRWSNP